MKDKSHKVLSSFRKTSFVRNDKAFEQNNDHVVDFDDIARHYECFHKPIIEFKKTVVCLSKTTCLATNYSFISKHVDFAGPCIVFFGQTTNYIFYN